MSRCEQDRAKPDPAPRAGLGRQPQHDMTADEVVAIVSALESGGIEVWLDGGWGVDALLGEQTRAHDDLDLVVSLSDVPRLREVLAGRGYDMLGGAPPESFELVDAEGRQVDVHAVVWDDNGDGIYRTRQGGTWPYPARGFEGRGSVAGRGVHCLTPEVQVITHADYDLDDNDLHDLSRLRERFGEPRE
jgi:lincosamide nucleotidyltransferase A/C/D/E